MSRSRSGAGWSVLILSRYTAIGASSRLRALQFIPFLEAAGATVECAPLFNDHYITTLYASGKRDPATITMSYVRRLLILLRLRTYDVVWIEKELLPYLPKVVDALLYRSNVPFVLDFDDAIFHNYDENRRRIVRRIFANRLDRLLARASVVTVGNAYLGDYAARHGATDVRRLPTVVDTSRYAVVPPPAGVETRIVWIGSPSTAKYLGLVEAALRRLSARVPVRLVTIGAPPLTGCGVPLEQHAWDAATEADLISGCHIGIMPLPDEPWERGKCGYKLIQYMAAGRPVVASPVGVNVDIVTPAVGFLATTAEEWLAALTTLAADPELQRRLGTAGRVRVDAAFSTRVVGPGFVGALAHAARVVA